MMRWARKLWHDHRAAVAPTVALSLFALIGAGGLAFDYAHMAALDTELQNAADQAALAAATQLDGGTNARLRATAAAQNLVHNNSLFANDGGGSAVTVPTASITFYASYDRVNDTFGAVATTDATAKVVKVAILGRTANFAFTPIVRTFSSGTINAEAIASLATTICKVPPVMICNPDEPNDFDANALAGRGLRLISVGNGSSAWAPGNFGYLDTGSSTSNPNVELRQALGWITAPGDCSGLDGVNTRTGAGTSAVPALNTRFDIYEKVTGGATADSCPTGGSCPPSINTTKDAVRKAAPASASKCDYAKNNEWEAPAKPYLPTSPTADLDLSIAANVPDAMGHPRDKCHAVSINGMCTYKGGTQTKIGDGNWDRNAYFKVNYGWTSAQWPGFINSGSSPISTSSPKRYQVYLWEIANRGTTIGGKVILPTAGRTYGSGSNARTDYDQPQCSQLQPYGSGVVPGGSNVDRRRISAAVINCTANNVHGGGGTVYPVLKWIELFLVEPSLPRTNTDKNDIYVEIIGETSSGAAGNNPSQVVRRDVPYLIR